MTTQDQHPRASPLRNAWRLYVGKGIRNQPSTPSTILHDEHHRVLRRYEGGNRNQNPVLLVPPLAAPARAFDLRPGLSLAQHLVGKQRPTYVIDYGEISRCDRNLGFEEWTEDIVPAAIRQVSADADGKPVDVIGWCLGGTISLLTLASHPDLPVRSLVTVATPIDYAQAGLDWVRNIARLTRGQVMTSFAKLLGGIPGAVNRLYYKWSTPMRQLAKPWFIVRHLTRVEKLIHMRAVDEFMAAMPAYPGRLFIQMYRQMVLGNELARGILRLPTREVSLAQVNVPVLAVAGKSDAIAPVPAAKAMTHVLTGAPSVDFHVVPGGHLGTLTGPSAPSTTWAHVDEFHARLAA